MESTGRDLEKTSSITIKINGCKKYKKRLRKLNKEIKKLNRTLEKTVELKKKLF